MKARREYDRERTWMLEQETFVQQTAICTNDERCQAAADQHDPDCPVEHGLREEFGF